MRRLVYVFLSGLALFTSTCLEGKIEELASVEALLDMADPAVSQIFIFDIDNTIYHPKQMLGSDEWFESFLNTQYEQYGKSSIIQQQVVSLWRAIQTVSQVVPIEEKVTSVIQGIQDKKCCLMAMTTRGDEMAATTLRQVHSLKIDLKRTAPTTVSFPIQKRPDMRYSSGILFTNAGPKGEALSSFLQQIQFTPVQIIYINDKMGPLEEVAAVLPKNIQYFGFRYSGADRYVQAFSPVIAQLELERFENIFSDEEAALYAERESFKKGL